MASIAKVITVIGSSPDGFAEAAQVAVSGGGERPCAASTAPRSSR